MNHDELVEAVARAIAEECGSDRYATAAAHAAISTAEPLIRADERKRVVDWLRDRWANGPGTTADLWFADAIEAGDYRKGEA